MFVVTFGSTLLCWYAWIFVLAMIDIRPEKKDLDIGIVNTMENAKLPEYFDAVEEKTGQNKSHNLP